MSERIVYIGTYSADETEAGLSRGIYVYKMDANSGALSLHGSVDDSFNPAYLALSQDGRFLYAADELDDAATISGYQIDRATGQLSFINRQRFPGSGTCNLNLSADGRLLFAANYTGGNMLSVRISGGGAVGSLAANVRHRGASANKQRQDKPYAHCAMPDRGSRFVVACDLGTDELYSYKIDPESGALRLAQVEGVPMGEGPRHLIFDRNGDRAFLITELGNHVIRYEYDQTDGALIRRQMISALPEGTNDAFAGADIHLSSDEHALFASVRDTSGQGADVITCFAFDGDALVKDGFIPTGRIPRGFEVSPDGRFLVVCCQGDNRVQVFDIATRKQVSEVIVPAPACVKFGV